MPLSLLALFPTPSPSCLALCRAKDLYRELGTVTARAWRGPPWYQSAAIRKPSQATRDMMLTRYSVPDSPASTCYLSPILVSALTQSALHRLDTLLTQVTSHARQSQIPENMLA